MPELRQTSSPRFIWITFSQHVRRSISFQDLLGHSVSQYCIWFFREGISLVEWPSRLFPHSDLMPPPTNRLDIDLSIVPSTDERRMTLTTLVGSTWKGRLQHLLDEGMLDDLLLDDRGAIDDDVD